MPTAAKLVGAIAFFGVGWLAALQVLPTQPEGTVGRFFPVTIAMIGLWQGWAVAGAMAGRGMRLAIGAGVRTSVQMALIGLIVFALREMFRRSSRLLYDGAGEATVATLELFLEYLVQSLTVPIWSVLIAGGILGGILCEVAARRWR